MNIVFITACLCLSFSACGAPVITQVPERASSEIVEITRVSCEQVATEFGTLMASEPQPIRLYGSMDQYPIYPLSSETPESFRDDLDARGSSPVEYLTITEDAIAVNQVRLSMDQLRQRLARLADLRDYVAPPPFGIVASPDVSMQRVSEVLVPVVELGSSVFLLAAGPIPMPPRPCPPGLESICGLAPSEPYAIARALGRATERCQPIRDVYRVLAFFFWEHDRNEILRERVPDALIACDCQADMPVIQYTILESMGMFRPRGVRLSYPGVAVPGADVGEWVRAQPNPNWSVRHYPPE